MSEGLSKEELEQLKVALLSGEVMVAFKKADGSDREMRCTQNWRMIPEDQQASEPSVLMPVDLEKVFDLDVNGWRSFKPSRVTSWWFDV